MEFSRKVRNFSLCEELGVVESPRKYSVSKGTLYSWKKKHGNYGETGLKVPYDSRLMPNKIMIFCEL